MGEEEEERRKQSQKHRRQAKREEGETTQGQGKRDIDKRTHRCSSFTE